MRGIYWHHAQEFYENILPFNQEDTFILWNPLPDPTLLMLWAWPCRVKKGSHEKSLPQRWHLFGGHYPKPPHQTALFRLALASHQRMAKLRHWILLLHIERALSWTHPCFSWSTGQSLVSPQWYRAYLLENFTEGQRKWVSLARGTQTVLYPASVAPSKSSGTVFEQTCIWANQPLPVLNVWTLNNQVLWCSMLGVGKRMGQGHITESIGLS